MRLLRKHRTGSRRQQPRSVARQTGSQIAEFAVALPLLLIMVVGIFDFGNAYNIKQKVTNIAREAARMGASQPTADLTNPTPASILAIRDMVVQRFAEQQAARLRTGNNSRHSRGRSHSVEVDVYDVMRKRG